MEYGQITQSDLAAIAPLHTAYKRAIGEDEPDAAALRRLGDAIAQGRIAFYCVKDGGTLVGLCSICKVFSTFDYQTGGVFEDFYILPAYRGRGIARALVQFAYAHSGVSTLTVGCADCDRGMYQSLGFGCAIGNLLAYGK